MAVVQISKIQVRRGKKNSNSGIPQLSSAEFAWAIDSQELYIGNGSVLEGAPYVGNTKILTEHDNLLDLISSYQFAYNDTAITYSVPRGLQSKLDEYVSVADFGAVGDGSTDNSAAFQTALNELFKNPQAVYRKVLLVPNGTYKFSAGINIPSNAIIKGETRNGVVLDFGVNGIGLTTTLGTGLVNFSSSDRPENIEISNLTISRTTGTLTLTGLNTGKFDNVTFEGDYRLVDGAVNIDTTPAAIYWSNTLDGTKVTNIKFTSCLFASNGVSIKCNQTAAFETVAHFDDTKFFVGYLAVYLVGVIGQSNKWHLNDCHFEELYSQAFRATHGKNTTIQSSTFKNCGNGNNTSISPIDPIVYFGEKTNNIVINCTSDRQQDAGIVTSALTVAIGEVYNADKASFRDRVYATISKSDNFTPLAVLSAFNKYFTINYFLELGTHSRVGQVSLAIGDQLGEISISDHYQYSPNLISTPEGALMTKFEFKAELVSNSGRTDLIGTNDSSLGADTIVLYYKNPNATGAAGTISFDVAYGV